MNTPSKLAQWLYLLAIFFMLSGGAIYFFIQQFMPYHAVAVATPWAELEPLLQVLIISSLNAGGGLTVCNALAMTILLIIPFKQGELWASWAISSIGCLSMLVGLRSAIYVDANTPANPPWFVFVIVIVLLSVALVASVKQNKKVNRQNQSW